MDGKESPDVRSKALEISSLALQTAHAHNLPLTGSAELPARDDARPSNPFAVRPHAQMETVLLVRELISACESARPFVLHAGRHWSLSRIQNATVMIDNAITKARAWIAKHS